MRKACFVRAVSFDGTLSTARRRAARATGGRQREQIEKQWTAEFNFILKAIHLCRRAAKDWLETSRGSLDRNGEIEMNTGRNKIEIEYKTDIGTGRGTKIEIEQDQYHDID
ncbi:hypothetical protein EVAR_41736_1 [Eumeta japonica]|uniref:Uncharacterized protein n=1 Tax=Eumeta variegata TaxID=151549 RepID=A0A4C1XDE1_EUMVA|nr:hypothetical protein EVAR_41736_1 [Eumeta japonica]